VGKVKVTSSFVVKLVTVYVMCRTITVCVLRFCGNKHLAVHVRVISDAYVCYTCMLYVCYITVLFNCFFSVTYYILCGCYLQCSSVVRFIHNCSRLG
jgi:ABC-type uncharacterized transport system permease subunit